MIADEKDAQIMRMVGFKIALFMYIRFGKPTRKAGGIVNLHRNKIRYNLQFSTLMHKEHLESKSKNIIVQFLNDLNVKKDIVVKGRIAYHQFLGF